MSESDVVHNTGKPHIEHLSYVDGGFSECWCMSECCMSRNSEGHIVCICGECCCKSPEYQALWDEKSEVEYEDGS